MSALSSFFNACRKGSYNEVRGLIDSGVDVNAREYDDITQFLMEPPSDCSDPDSHINSFEQDGRNALHIAVKHGRESIIPMLIEAGIDINAKTNGDEENLLEAENALHIAIKNGHESIIPILIEAGIDINAKELYRGATPFHVALRKGRENMLLILIEAGIDLKEKDKRGHNAFLSAVDHACESIIPMLIEAGVDINAQTDDGENALRIVTGPYYNLEWVCGNGMHITSRDYDMARLLVDAGCTLSEEDLQHDTVQNALAANAERREGAKSAMAEIDFPRRVAGSMVDSDFPQIRNTILSFIFLSPRES